MKYIQYQTPERILGKFQSIKEPDRFWLNKRVLDIGCAEGLLYPILKPLVARYIGIDTSEVYIEKASNRFPEADFRLQSMYDFDQEVDIVVSFSTLHIPDDFEFESLVKKYSKLCKTFIFEVPVVGSSPIYHTRTEEFLEGICRNYFKTFECYGISPSPHDIQSVRKTFKCTK